MPNSFDKNMRIIPKFRFLSASAHAFVASRVYVRMAELSEVREVSTAAKKADKTEKKVQRKNSRWEAVMIEHLNISV